VIGVDDDAPTITAAVDIAPNAAGWNNTKLPVTFTYSDATSGVASCPSTMVVSAEGANQLVAGTEADRPGNTVKAWVTLNLSLMYGQRQREVCTEVGFVDGRLPMQGKCPKG